MLLYKKLLLMTFGTTYIQSASSFSLLDVQTVDNHPLIVSPGMKKTAVDPVFLITSCAICHVQLHCLLCTVVRTDQKLNVVSFCSFSFCLCIYVRPTKLLFCAVANSYKYL